MIDSRQFEQAEAVALEVKQWGLTYSLFDDTPDKVAADSGDARRRAAVRNAELLVKTYSELMQESRQLMKLGHLDRPRRR